MSLDALSVTEQLRSKDAQIAKLAGTLAHYRSWAAQLQARYQMFNPDAARPARRIYVGGLPPDTADVRSLGVCLPCTGKMACTRGASNHDSK
jgi:hypothetical protein